SDDDQRGGRQRAQVGVGPSPANDVEGDQVRSRETAGVTRVEISVLDIDAIRSRRPVAAVTAADIVEVPQVRLAPVDREVRGGEIRKAAAPPLQRKRSKGVAQLALGEFRPEMRPSTSPIS